MDSYKRQQLIARIKQQALPGLQPMLPVVSLEEFFEGNDDYGSIGCNLTEHPGPQTFFQILSDIRFQPSVQTVLVEIAEVEEQDATMWPFSERIYLLTSATREQVENWLSALQPDEVSSGYVFGTPPAAPQLQEGMQVYNAWWD